MSRPKKSPAGSIDKDVLRRRVQHFSKQVRGCYEHRLKQAPGITGRIDVRWKIGANGDVVSVEIAENGTGDKRLASCLRKTILRWRFPKPKGGGEVVVNYPFVFRQ